MQRATKPIHFPKFTRNLRCGWGKPGLSRPSNALDYWILGQSGDNAGLELESVVTQSRLQGRCRHLDQSPTASAFLGVAAFRVQLAPPVVVPERGIASIALPVITVTVTVTVTDRDIPDHCARPTTPARSCRACPAPAQSPVPPGAHSSIGPSPPAYGAPHPNIKKPSGIPVGAAFA